MKNQFGYCSVNNEFICFAAAPITNKSPAKDQFSYSYGYLMGRNNTDALTDLNLDIFTKVYKKVLKIRQHA